MLRSSWQTVNIGDKGCSAPVLQFGPDAAFACDVSDDQRAEAFLKQHDLKAGRFLCCIPRLRYTPYWTIKNRPFEPDKHARNEQMQEHDHDQLKAAIVQIVKPILMSGTIQRHQSRAFSGIVTDARLALV